MDATMIEKAQRTAAKKPLLLDLFCGAGGAAMGYYRAGFNVVGVDIEPQPNYPFPFLQREAILTMQQLLHGEEIRFSSGVQVCLDDIAAIHASPPCQAHTRIRKLVESRYGWQDYLDYTGQTRLILKIISKPSVLENVPGAPINPDIRLNGLMFGLRVLRERWFECVNWQPPLLQHPLPKKPRKWTTNAYRGISGFRHGAQLIGVHGNNFILDDARVAMGIDWMNSNEIAEAIPPAYTEYIGKMLLEVANGRNDD